MESERRVKSTRQRRRAGDIPSMTEPLNCNSNHISGDFEGKRETERK